MGCRQWETVYTAQVIAGRILIGGGWVRRTIRGSRYDTEIATLRGERQSVVGEAWYVELLYETPRGRWFLHGAGGPDSPWGVWTRNGLRVDGEAIRPVTAESAQIWLGRYGGVDRRRKTR